MLDFPGSDRVLSSVNVKDIAADVIGQHPLRGIEGSPLDTGDI